jgi:hypothetical protein
MVATSRETSRATNRNVNRNANTSTNVGFEVDKTHKATTNSLPIIAKCLCFGVQDYGPEQYIRMVLKMMRPKQNRTHEHHVTTDRQSLLLAPNSSLAKGLRSAAHSSEQLLLRSRKPL